MEPDEAWLAYYHDWSAMAVFDSEIECLRYAVERQMQVRPVSYGEDLREQVSRG